MRTPVILLVIIVVVVLVLALYVSFLLVSTTGY